MSRIQWTGQTCNAIIGCSKVSPGCLNCYAERMACRQAHMGNQNYFKVISLKGAFTKTWNDKTAFIQSALDKVLKRKKSTMYFMSSMGDMFHKSVPFEWIDKVWAVMRQCEQHKFQILTKRPKRMAEYLSPNNERYTARKVADLLPPDYPGTFDADMYWPLDHLWLGTTAENQEMADKRVPELLKCPAAKRFVSVEPMLGPVDFEDSVVDLYGVGAKVWRCIRCGWTGHRDELSGGNLRISCPKTGCDASNGIVGPTETDGLEIIETEPRIDWVICGCESGPGARPMKLEWARSLRDQCKAAGVPFFMKQLTMTGCRKCGFDPCTHLNGHRPKEFLIRDINQFPEDLRIQEYPK